MRAEAIAMANEQLRKYSAKLVKNPEPSERRPDCPIM